MKLIILASAVLFSPACVEPIDEGDPAARAGVSDPTTTCDDGTPGSCTVETPSGPAAPQCGDGPVTYWDWVCLNDGTGWHLREVGSRGYNCNSGPDVPYIEPLVGRTTTCQSSERTECSTGLPSSTCYYGNTGSHCNLPRPTTYCYVRPTPLPPPGGVFY